MRSEWPEAEVCLATVFFWNSYSRPLDALKMAQEADERRGGEIKKEIQKESREPGEIRRRRRHLGVSLEVRMCLFLVVTTAVKESVVCFSVGKNHALRLLRYGRTVGV